ncbi:MAG: DUF5681 domain-containing protein [Mesorhizobium sp.]
MSEEPEKPHLFKEGRSGNPNGRPRGSRNKAIAALEAIGEGEVHEIVQALIEKAKGGDAVAAKPILDRVWPVRKGARVEFDLPSVSEAKELPVAIAGVTEQVASGAISPDEGALIVSLLEAQERQSKR